MPSDEIPKGFVDASVFLAIYTMDAFYDWAKVQLDAAGTTYAPVTCDLCVGEVVANVVDRPLIGDSVWHDAVVDLIARLRTFQIVRVRGRPSRCETAIWEINNIQWKDKVWLSNAIGEGVCHIYTTDKDVWENQTQLTRASGRLNGPAVKVHAPYKRR